ncbi:MAG TPA: FimV/HubP family polar landmark protein [Casimicrobiaceae bacterium]|nr:FimV/HubP family polar landmark protein [Casimicrobiaceae bacterium]
MRAKPFISGSLLAGVLTLSVPALALGLGKLTVNSGLGQPLSAQIELTAAQRDELDSLRARIADPSVYRDNGAQYVGALARARITVEQGASASYLRVTTAAPVNEPFLNLIIELSWATGRVVRDYTFLLDPPGATEMQAIEPAAPIRPEAAPTRTTRAGRRAAEAAVSAPSTSTTSTAPDSAGSYTVKRGDTLSKIANQYKPENVSLEQMLVALFRSNESAFDANNMNRLRSGQILTVPQGNQIAPLAQDEAVKEVKVQAADWRSYRDHVAAAAPASDTTAARQSGGGKIGTAVEDQAAATLGGRDRVSVSREPGKGTAAASREDLVAKDKALREANARVAELEKTVRDLQKAAALKSQTMSDLQTKAEAGKGTTAEAPKAPDTQVAAVTPPTTTPPAATTAAPSPGTTVSTPTTAPPPVTTTATPPSGTTTETPAPGTTTAAAPSGTTTVVPPVVIPPPEAKAPDTTVLETKAPETKAVPPPEPKATVPKSAVPPKKATEVSFIDELFGNTPTWVVGGGALVVLGGIAAIIAARRRKTTKFEDSIISGTDIKTNTVFGSTGGGVVNTGDNSLASDFSREGLGNIDTDEVDPIAEAEVYLAYGRDAQAEEILKDALKKDPQRQEIYLKLLEIHAQHNKPSAFETVASELYSVSGGQGEVWQKAMALGRQLDPANPLFAEAGGGAAFATATTVAAAHTASETHEPSVASDITPEPRGGAPLDFTLDDDISLSPTSGEVDTKSHAATHSASEPPTIHFEKPAVSAATLAASAAGAVAAAAAARAAVEKSPPTVRETVSFEPESIPRFDDLDFHLDEPSRPAPSAPRPVPAISPAIAREPALVTAGAPAPQLTRPAAAIELDKLDLAFDPKRSTFEDPTPSVLDGQWHDAATKLDLAKAYQEMGDVEGAREILQEVLHEGDDEQKAEAQALITKLA